MTRHSMRYLSLSFTVGGVLLGQATVERAVIGGAGAASGAGIGRSIVGIMKNVDGQAKQAAGAVSAPAPPARPTAPRSTGSVPAPELAALNDGIAPPKGAPRGSVGIAGLDRQPEEAAKPEPAAVPAVASTTSTAPSPPADVSLAALRAVQAGLSRQEVLAKLGSPAMRLTIPDSQGEIEILRYRSGGKDAAVIRVVAGAVKSIDLLQ